MDAFLVAVFVVGVFAFFWIYTFGPATYIEPRDQFR